jgi:hypothetical protein
METREVWSERKDIIFKQFIAYCCILFGHRTQENDQGTGEDGGDVAEGNEGGKRKMRGR